MQLNDPDKYFNYFRMSSETFRRLLALVGPLITKQEYIREPIPPRTRLEVTLRYLASRDSMTSISYAFRIGHNISKIIAETCEVIWTTLKEEVFLQPNETNWQTINEDFDKHWNFPHCIGAINGKHIVGGTQRQLIVARASIITKGTIASMPAVSDAKYRFIIVDIGALGRQDDSGVLTNSGLINLLEDNKLKIPQAALLNNSSKEFSFVFVADEAFPLTTYMMRPYPRSGSLNITKKILIIDLVAREELLRVRLEY
ncbi:PREDICTED: uncharacterized protein LOC108770818 [Trachymyrmex cornetzi]|uniref:uncharacterized protein LOC108770818 n=1 Tax=Trachymyrmex cornetzi TaxID=471704 RepID=UPI00084F4E4E|nr:PREDICTED: uncharacterized protein LOC108770818 [Trachymyrmex cornetzi]